MLRIRSVLTGVAGAPWYLNMYFSGDDQTSAEAARDRVSTFWTTLAPVIIDDVTVTVEGNVPVIEPADGSLRGFLGVTEAVIEPTSTGDPLPFATQGLITTNTDVVRDNRRVQGKLLIPGMTETGQSTGVGPSAANLTLMDDAAEGLWSALPEEGLVVWSRPKGAESPFPGPGLEAKVTSTTARGFWAVLRSRRD